MTTGPRQQSATKGAMMIAVTMPAVGLSSKALSVLIADP
jgi:hypothetical protein